MHRQLDRLTAPEIDRALTSTSVLCLPIGSHEQHGPHLPLNTDTVIAEQFTRRLVDRYGASHDLWMTPALPYGLSLEHAWSPGTVSLTIRVFTELLDVICAQHRDATPAGNLAIINGHGGNRGILEAVIHELRQRHDVNICVIHPSSLATDPTVSEMPDIHAGPRETSMMLALAPDDVHVDRIPHNYPAQLHDTALTRQVVLDRGVTWPWTSHDAIARDGIIGADPRHATAERGERLIASALDRCRDVLDHLIKARPTDRRTEGECPR
jgi:creatinine amidohydrolase